MLPAKGKYTFIRNSFCLRATWAKKLRSFTSPNFSFIIDIALQTSFVINIGQRRKPFFTSYFNIYFSFLYEGTTCETSSTIKRKKKKVHNCNDWIISINYKILYSLLNLKRFMCLRIWISSLALKNAFNINKRTYFDYSLCQDFLYKNISFTLKTFITREVKVN